jgi:hypothetical protein
MLLKFETALISLNIALISIKKAKNAGFPGYAFHAIGDRRLAIDATILDPRRERYVGRRNKSAVLKESLQNSSLREAQRRSNL